VNTTPQLAFNVFNTFLIANIQLIPSVWGVIVGVAVSCFHFSCSQRSLNVVVFIFAFLANAVFYLFTLFFYYYFAVQQRQSPKSIKHHVVSAVVVVAVVAGASSLPPCFCCFGFNFLLKVAEPQAKVKLFFLPR